MATDEWYGGGLRFSCTGCGHCCTGTSGVVRVSNLEIGRLALRLALRNEEFRAMYTRELHGGDVSLREHRNGDCVFYDAGGGCRVYTDRPGQCRTWPFWRSVVHSAERWAEEAAGCPGMDAGRLYPADQIRSLSERATLRPPAP